MPNITLSVDDEIIKKYRTAVSATIAQERAQSIQSACWGCAQLESIHELVGLLADPISARRN